MTGLRCYILSITAGLAIAIAVALAAPYILVSYRSSYHSRLYLENADALIALAGSMNSSAIYKFAISWIMRPGRTNISIVVLGLKCRRGPGYTITACINGRCVSAAGPLSVVVDRREPFLYMKILIRITPSCRVPRGEPVVEVRACVS